MDFRRATILVADDNPENLRVLSTMLKPEGYVVRVASDGKRALASMESSTPDLVMLDIHMPELDGYGTFERMKHSAALADTPVIFLTALSEAFHKVKAFEMGAADYICKPFEAQEVLARVSSQLRLLDMRRNLNERNRKLEEANAQLEEHERYRQLFTQMLVHDMRGPLTATLGTLDLLREESGEDTSSAALLRDARVAAGQLEVLVSGLLDISRARAGALQPELEHGQIAPLIEKSLGVVSGLAIGRLLKHSLPSHLPEICCDPSLIERVIINLVDNALKHTPVNEPVELSVSECPGGVRIRVSDRGPGIPPDERARIFDMFTRLDAPSSRRPSTGLGLAFCKLAIEAHGQEILVESGETGGAVFSFKLPSTAACRHARAPAPS